MNEATLSTEGVASFHVGKSCSHEIRTCVQCFEPFEWCSMHPRQETCTKACWDRRARRKNTLPFTVVADVPASHVVAKTCPSCGEFLPATAFHRNKNRPLGLQEYCSDCHRIFWVMDKYEVDRETAIRLDGTKLCDICGGEVKGRNRRLDIDHCHDTGVVRGSLCNPCNKLLGYARNSPDLLRRAANYLSNQQP